MEDTAFSFGRHKMHITAEKIAILFYFSSLLKYTIL